MSYKLCDPERYIVPSPDKILEEKILRLTLRALIDASGKHAHRLLNLRYGLDSGESMTWKEVGKCVGRSGGTVQEQHDRWLIPHLRILLGQNRKEAYRDVKSYEGLSYDQICRNIDDRKRKRQITKKRRRSWYDLPANKRGLMEPRVARIWNFLREGDGMARPQAMKCPLHGKRSPFIGVDPKKKGLYECPGEPVLDPKTKEPVKGHLPKHGFDEDGVKHSLAYMNAFRGSTKPYKPVQPLKAAMKLAKPEPYIDPAPEPDEGEDVAEAVDTAESGDRIEAGKDSARETEGGVKDSTQDEKEKEGS